MNTSTILTYLRSDPTIANDIDGFIARMNAKTIRHENHELVNSLEIMRRFGYEKAAQWAAVFNKNGGLVVLNTVCAGGLDFASPQVQGVLDQLIAAGQFTAEDGADLKGIGISYTSIADANGGECTRRNVEDAITILAREPLQEDAERRHRKVLSAIESGAAKTKEQMATIYAED